MIPISDMLLLRLAISLYHEGEEKGIRHKEADFEGIEGLWRDVFKRT
jgi:hypothetical protein